MMKNLFYLIIIFNIITNTVKAELPNIVAVVNNKPITLNEFRARKHMFMVINNAHNLSPQENKKLDQLVVNSLIDDTLLYESLKSGKGPSEKEINNALNEIAQRNNMNGNQLLQFLRSKSIDIDSYKSHIKAEIIKMNILANFSKSVSVTPKEIHSTAFATNSSNAEITAQIFTSKDKHNKTLSKMNSLRKSLKDCDHINSSLYKNFATLENTHQQLSNLDLATQTIIKDLNINDKSGVFEAKDGFKLILLCDKKVTTEKNDSILNFLANKKMEQQAQKYLDNIRKKAYIKVMLPL